MANGFASGAVWIFEVGAVMEHLGWAARTVRRGLLTAKGVAIRGQLGFEGGVVVFRPDRHTPIPAGTSVTVEYAGPRDLYRFVSRVHRALGDDVLLDAPWSVQRNRRFTLRRIVEGLEGYTFRPSSMYGGGAFALYDLSVGGLSALLPSDHPRLHRDATFEGELLVPNEAPFRLRCEERNARVHRDARYTVLGARIVGVAEVDRARLAHAVARIVEPVG